jgi:biotin transport system permease protein
MLSIRLAGNSWAHKLRVGPKMAALAVVSVALFWVDAWIVLALALFCVVALYASVDGALRKGAWLMKPILWIVGIIWIFHAFRGEYLAGSVVCLRLLVLVGLANFVTLTSRLTDMIDLFLWMLSPLERVGVRIGAIGLALGMVMRFTPVLIERTGQLTQSWRARGGKRASWRIILPLFITVVDDADRVAEALRARGGIQ